MEALVKLVAENVVILGSVVTVTFSFLLLMWYRISSKTSEVETLDDFWLEETQSKTRKPGKVRPKKTKTEKVCNFILTCFAYI